MRSGLTLFTGKQLEPSAVAPATLTRAPSRQDQVRRRRAPSQRHVRYLWQALRKFSPENRARFLRFVWGRTRLPATPAEWGDTRFTLHTRHTPRPDEAYPVAHTCFFSLELPAYTSFAVCYERLHYAITNCLAIDIDTTTSARENRERHIEGLEDDGDGLAGSSDEQTRL